MITIALVLMSISLIIGGNMPLLGGKRVRGIWVRIGGFVLLALSFLFSYLPSKQSLIVLVSILVLLALVYLFVKGEEPTKKESKSNLFSYSKDELKTYFDAAKGILIFFVVMACMFGALLLTISFIPKPH